MQLIDKQGYQLEFCDIAMYMILAYIRVEAWYLRKLTMRIVMCYGQIIVIHKTKKLACDLVCYESKKTFYGIKIF